MEILLNHDGDARPCDRIHETAKKYDPGYSLIGHEKDRTMTLFLETDKLPQLVEELEGEGIRTLSITNQNLCV